MKYFRFEREKRSVQFRIYYYADPDPGSKKCYPLGSGSKEENTPKNAELNLSK